MNGNNGGVPTRADLAKFQVNRPGWEAIRQTLYDYQAYAAAGQTQLAFFQQPVGQNARTLSDTNMTLAGQLPANQEFLVQSIEVVFFPTTPTVAAAMPSFFGADAAQVLVNDAYIFGRSGNLNFTVGSKPYLQEAPVGRFPPKTNFDVSAALATNLTTGAATQTRTGYGKWVGRPYLLTPAEILLVSNQNFVVTLAWPEGVQAISNPARVGVVLDGILYRRSQ